MRQLRSKSGLWLLAALVVGGALAGGARAGEGATGSTFDDDADGWTVGSSPVVEGPTFHATGGNPGGYISAFIPAGPQNFDWAFWIAPAKFRTVAANGQPLTLSFDLRDSGSKGKFLKGVDVFLDNGTKVVVHKITKKPSATKWTHYVVKLDGKKNWIDDDTHKKPKPGVMQEVLGALVELSIRGEYIKGGPETMDLDNVQLGSGNV